MKNNKSILKIIRLLIGRYDEFDIEHRYMNFAIFIACIFALFYLPINYLLGNADGTLCVSIFTCILFPFIYFLSRIKKYFTIPFWLFYITTSVLFSINFIYNAGSYGPTAYMYMSIVPLFILIAKGFNRLIVGDLIFVNITGLYIFEHLYPKKIVYYVDELSRIIDNYIALCITMLLIASILVFLKDYYNRLHDINIKLIKELEFEKGKNSKIIENSDNNSTMNTSKS